MSKSKKKPKTVSRTALARKRRSLVPDYDTAWKEIIERHFERVMEFLFPDIYRDIDFSKGVEILSNELRRIVPKGKIGKRHVDVLVKVFLKENPMQCCCVFIHIEVQGTGQVSFMARVFEYYYRIFEKYMEKGVEIVTLAVLTDEDPEYRPDNYYYTRWNFEHKLKVPMVKIIDFTIKPELIEKLETSMNPVALVVKVQLKSMEIKKKDVTQKFNLKRELIRELYSHGYDKAYILSLFLFIDLVFPLPEEMETVITKDVNIYAEETKMEPMTSFERIAIKKGLKEGKREGKKEALSEVIRMMLNDGMNIEKIRQYVKLPDKEFNRLCAAAQ